MTACATPSRATLLSWHLRWAVNASGTLPGMLASFSSLTREAAAATTWMVSEADRRVIGVQVALKVAELHSQQRNLTGEVEAELNKAKAECTAAMEAAHMQAEQQAEMHASTIRRLKGQV